LLCRHCLQTLMECGRNMNVWNLLIWSLTISKYLTRSRWLRINKVQLYLILIFHCINTKLKSLIKKIKNYSLFMFFMTSWARADEWRFRVQVGDRPRWEEPPVESQARHPVCLHGPPAWIQGRGYSINTFTLLFI